ncbi:MAG: type III-B CRISPR module RAMP protein Cmr4, partial [Candidatus Woesearchaeota archaeon]
MYKLVQPFFIIVESPFHAGSGDSLGIVDMPIQRERHTEFPKIEGSSVKGCLRSWFSEDENQKHIALIFGPDDGAKHAGALGFTDARLLLFPVRSVKGIYAWITCPLVLKRFMKDIKLFDKNSIKIEIPDKNTIPDDGSDILINEKDIILEEYSFQVKG